MQYLLDTHTFIWFSENDKMLLKRAAELILRASNNCYISIASLWEIAIKSQNGKLLIQIPFDKITDFLFENNITVLPIEIGHLQSLFALDFHHRDPFDRIIIAQAISANLTILGVDKHFKSYPVKCIW